MRELTIRKLSIFIVCVIVIVAVNNNFKESINKQNNKVYAKEIISKENKEFKPTYPQYHIPLPAELQEYTYKLCKAYSVPYERVIAVMKVESDFDPKCISDTNDIGIMQINVSNFKWLKKELCITDFLDPKQNILAGVYMLSMLQKKYKDEHQIFTAYNMGEPMTNKLTNRGITNTKYSRLVIKTKNELIRR